MNGDITVACNNHDGRPLGSQSYSRHPRGGVVFPRSTNCPGASSLTPAKFSTVAALTSVEVLG